MRSGVRVRAAVVVASLVLVSVALVGCGSASTDNGASDNESTGVVPGAGVTGDGAALVQSKCTTCHNLDRVDAATKDLAEWQTTITRMVQQNGAVITTEEQSAIALYLSSK